MNSNDILSLIHKAMDAEIESIQVFRKSVGAEFAEAAQMIYSSEGKVVLTGVGKSGDIAKKISSTMTSTGTEAIFLHPTDAAHGDAGGIRKDDVVLAIGKSGESDELLFLIPTIKRIGAKLIALTANPKSRLALAADLLLYTPVEKEACPLDLAPTSSTTIALLAGDALAMALMEMRNFKAEDFALYHPSGRLGKRLSLSIEDVMRKNDLIPKASPSAKLEEILNEITGKYLGAVCIVDSENFLQGIITDYDLRKRLSEGSLSKDLQAEEMMNKNPIRFLTGRKAYDILKEMEDRKRPISVAPIIEENGKLAGIVSLHDLLQKGL